MKKYLTGLAVLILFLAACDPNKEIYDEIKTNELPYRKDFGITLSAADYTNIKNLALKQAYTSPDSANANAIDLYDNFAHNRPASVYVPAFLDAAYLAPDSASTVLVSYNYSLNEYDSIAEYKLTNSDYSSLGLEADMAFSSINRPGTKLPGFLASISTTENFVFFITAKYKYSDTKTSDTSFCYTYADEKWALIADSYILAAEDYDGMGNPGPGQYDNFSSSYLPDFYLPIFLQNKYPYASEGNQKTVAYKYYSGGVNTLFDVYRYESGGWKKNTIKTEQFIHNGTQWLFDPTVHYKMAKSDYQLIIDYVANNPDIQDYIDPQYDDTEYYYGASAYYGNFDLRISKRTDNDPQELLAGLSDTQKQALFVERIKEALVLFLETKFPNQVSVSNGVQVFYELTYATYEPGNYTYTMRFKCYDTGKFEFVEGPSAQ